MKWVMACSIYAFLFIGMILVPTEAKQNGDSVEFSFSGHVKAVTRCSINGGNPVEVHFGNVGINKIDGGGYIKDVDYTIDCGKATPDNIVTMKVVATPELWDPSAIHSNVDGLGIRIILEGKPIGLNTNIKIDDSHKPPKLQALVVKQPDIELTEQPFEVTGALVVEYV